jgi:NADP-dependent aldehyde dehydrogenase
MSDEVETIARRSEKAQASFRSADLRTRAAALDAIADGIQRNSRALIALGEKETGLSQSRLEGEVVRTSVQLRVFAAEVIEGAFLDVRIDEADGAYLPAPRPDIRRYLAPIGPVLNFAASNFPFAFSVAGGDTASALAAGCSVVVKTHQGHPRLSEAVSALARNALATVGLDEDVLLTVAGRDRGVEMLNHPVIAAATFTGSFEAGTILARIASERETPIPFYGELGSLNPVFLFADTLAEHRDEVVAGLVASVTGSAGQLCTKPGLIFVPSSVDLAADIVGRVEGVPEHRLLYSGLADKYQRSLKAILSQDGVTTIVRRAVRHADDGAWVRPTIARVSFRDFSANLDRLTQEVFGPFTLLIDYETEDELLDAVSRLGGTLTSTIHAGSALSPVRAQLLDRLSRVSGRLVSGGWPTGVAVTAAMQHGGPWPASTNSQHTSVGATAIRRFLVPVAYQGFDQQLLPAPLQDANPWHVPQRRSRSHESATA